MDNEKYADIDIFHRETKYIDNQQRDTGRVLRLMFNVNVHKGVWGGPQVCAAWKAVWFGNFQDPLAAVYFQILGYNSLFPWGAINKL